MMETERQFESVTETIVYFDEEVKHGETAAGDAKATNSHEHNCTPELWDAAVVEPPSQRLTQTPTIQIIISAFFAFSWFLLWRNTEQRF